MKDEPVNLKLVFTAQLHRLVFSLRHSKEERVDLDWEQEENARRAHREAEERKREGNDGAGKERHFKRQIHETNAETSRFYQIKSRKSLPSVVWLGGCVAEEAPRPTIRTSPQNQRSCPTSPRATRGRTLWTPMLS